jgi:phage shock protein A
MGIFTRLRDIVSSNINAMLDKAEDPEKLIKLMIQEMEDTLVEIKASCAAAMADMKRIDAARQATFEHLELWEGRAELAMGKGREDLAREALLERKAAAGRLESLQRELAEQKAVVNQYQQDIAQLESKLETVREKHRTLTHRHAHAAGRKRAESSIRRTDTSDAWARFEGFENRIDRMEAEADLINAHRRSGKLEQEFQDLHGDEEVEAELAALRRRVGQAGSGTAQDDPGNR